MNIFYIWNRVLKKLQGRAINNSVIHDTSTIGAGSRIENVKMDRYSFCGYDCKIINCSIGAFCSIADNVIIGGARHPIEWVSTSPVFYSGRDSIKKKFAKFDREKDLRTVIENDVWIGDRATIKAGVHVANGAVIGMGSVVTKNIGPYEIWGGNPAKLIRKRFDEDIVNHLNESKWWESSDIELKRLSEYIKEPEEFIKQL